MVTRQLSVILGELEITPLTDSYCLMEADNETDSPTSLTVYGSLFQPCDLYIKALSSSQILISVVASNTSSTDYMYVERMGHLGVCSNRYVAFMELQQSCKANFGNTDIQLHFRGDFAIGIQDVMGGKYHSIGCPENVNQEDMVGALEGQTSNCKQAKGFQSVIECVRANHWWWIYEYFKVLPTDVNSTSRCDMQCPKNCSCILTDRQFVYNCLQNTKNLSKISTGLFLLPVDISLLDLSKNGISALTMDTFTNIGKNIRHLDLSSNFLTTLTPGLLDYLYNIVYLDLHNNSLAILDTKLFANLQNLICLDLWSNALVSLDVGVFTNLRSLTLLGLASNGLVTLDVGVFAKLHSLTHLFLSDNAQVTLDVGLFANLHNLTYLEMDKNELIALEGHVFVNLHKVRELSLIKNRLVALDHRTFHELTDLRYLYMNNNCISHLEDRTFAYLFLLERLSMAFNEIIFLHLHLFEDLHSLVQLDLTGNKLQTMPQIGHMTLLNKIDLFGNPLTQITKNMFSGFSSTASIFVDQPEVCICYFNGSDTCFNTIKPSPYLTCDQLLSLTALTVFMWIIGGSAVFGNVFVVWWKRFTKRTENKVQSLLLSNLAMSDLLMGAYMIIIASVDVYYGQYFPMNAEHWRSSILCRIAGTLAITSSEASVLFVTFISIDRFITIKFPYSIHKLRVKSTRLIATLVWTFSLTLGLSASILAGQNSNFYDNSHVCIGLPLAQVIHHKTQTIEAANIQYWIDPKTIEVFDQNFDQKPGLYFSVAVFIGFNLFCFLLILACYIGLIRAAFITSSKASRRKEMADEIRMTLKVSAIVLTDFFCWFPICLMGTFVQIGLIELPNSVFAWVVTFVLPINSAINPFLYTITTVIGDRWSRKTSGPANIQMKTQSRCF